MGAAAPAFDDHGMSKRRVTTMSLAALLSRLFHPSAEPRVAASAAASDDEPPLGCGWFDSSHELRHGLDVHELAALVIEPEFAAA